jgi:hypothetical protein
MEFPGEPTYTDEEKTDRQFPRMFAVVPYKNGILVNGHEYFGNLQEAMRYYRVLPE